MKNAKTPITSKLDGSRIAFNNKANRKELSKKASTQTTKSGYVEQHSQVDHHGAFNVIIDGKVLFAIDWGQYLTIKTKEEAEANAKRIVKAVNTHDAMKEFVNLMTSYDERFLSQDQFNTREGAEQELKWIKKKADKLTQLLGQAEGK